MDILTQEDLYAMLEPFAIDVIANQGTNNEYIFKAIFDNASKLYADGDVFSNTNPRLTCRTLDINGITKSNPLTIDGINRTIRDIQHQNWGISVLELKQ